MKAKKIPAVAALLLFTLQACMNPNKGTEARYADGTDSARQQVVIPDTAGFSRGGDMGIFMKEASLAGLKEIELGKLAAQKASDPKIQKFAKMMVKDHTRIAKKLKALADAKKVALPTTLPAADQQHLAELQKMPGKEFDKHYIDMMVKEHVKALDIFKSGSTLGDHPLQNFAARTLRVLEEHFKAAKDLDNYLN